MVTKIEKGVLVTFICYKYKIHQILMIDTIHRGRAERAVRRKFAPIFMKFIKSEAFEEFYTDDFNFDYILTLDWITRISW